MPPDSSTLGSLQIDPVLSYLTWTEPVCNDLTQTESGLCRVTG